MALFRDKELEQEVAYRRRSRASMLSEAFHVVPRQQPSIAPLAAPSVRERIGSQLEAIWRIALDLGRLPDAREVPLEVLEALSEARVSFERAVALCVQSFNPGMLQEAAEARRDDLLVHFALTLFPGAPRYTTLPRSIQRDVKTFFGSHAAAMETATGLLFSVGNPERVKVAIAEAIADGLGSACNRTFRFISFSLARMPPAIRVVIGCAEVIESDLGSFDFLELEPDTGLVRAVRCDDANKGLPKVTEIIEVDLKALRRKKIRPKDKILYLKARYLPADDPARISQRTIDEKLVRAGIVSADGKGPDAVALTQMLKPRGAASSRRLLKAEEKAGN